MRALNRNAIVAACAAIVLTISGTAQSVRPLVWSTERGARIDRLLQSFVDEGRIAGAVALVLQNGRPVYQRSIGWADKEANRPMAPDTIFRIASQSKAIVSAALLSLVEARESRHQRSRQPLHSGVRVDDRRRAA